MGFKEVDLCYCWVRCDWQWLDCKCLVFCFSEKKGEKDPNWSVIKLLFGGNMKGCIHAHNLITVPIICHLLPRLLSRAHAGLCWRVYDLCSTSPIPSFTLSLPGVYRLYATMWLVAWDFIRGASTPDSKDPTSCPGFRCPLQGQTLYLEEKKTCADCAWRRVATHPAEGQWWNRSHTAVTWSALTLQASCEVTHSRHQVPTQWLSCCTTAATFPLKVGHSSGLPE